MINLNLFPPSYKVFLFDLYFLLLVSSSLLVFFLSVYLLNITTIILHNRQSKISEAYNNKNVFFTLRSEVGYSSTWSFHYSTLWVYSKTILTGARLKQQSLSGASGSGRSTWDKAKSGKDIYSLSVTSTHILLAKTSHVVKLNINEVWNYTPPMNIFWTIIHPPWVTEIFRVSLSLFLFIWFSPLIPICLSYRLYVYTISHYGSYFNIYT